MTTSTNNHGWFPIQRAPIHDLTEAFPAKLRAGARSLWLEVLSRARQRPGTVEGQVLARGQLVFGEDKIGDVCGLSRQQVRTLHGRLVKLGKLTIKATNQGSVATVVDFDSYVPPETEANQGSGQQVTIDQPATNHIQQVTSNKSTKTASPSAHQRDDFMDEMVQMIHTHWPNLAPLEFSLLGKWRKEYGERNVLVMTKKIGLGGKQFPAREDLTSYLNGALSKEAVRRSDRMDSVPFTIADPLGNPITDPEDRLQRIVEQGAVADPDQAHWFTVPDAAIVAGEMDSATRQAILVKRPGKEDDR
jgi:hypothetical protein